MGSLPDDVGSGGIAIVDILCFAPLMEVPVQPRPDDSFQVTKTAAQYDAIDGKIRLRLLTEYISCHKYMWRHRHLSRNIFTW